jgi:hypothetical protein
MTSMSRGLALLAATLSSTLVLPPADARRPVRFTEAEIFLELNDTDGDLGLHASIDGDAWVTLEIDGPGEVGVLLSVAATGRLGRQGMTQLAFESAEPSFDELSPAEFFRRFPEGRYRIEAEAGDGSEVAALAHLSHVLAAPPENVQVSGVAAAEDCDTDPLPLATEPVTISWEPVTASHPELGRRGPVRLSRYQVFVEAPGVKWSVDLPPSVTSIEVPAGVTALGETFKFEIIARTTDGNNTAIESCFETP